MNISEKAKQQVESCRFCWMCRHVCPIGNATGLERNTARARALGVSVVARGAEKIEDIIDNIYECSLCGACTNNCITGWDPKIFIQEVKTDAIINGVVPTYIRALLDKYFECGNIYGEKHCDCLNEYIGKKSKTLFVVGQDAFYKSPKNVKTACELLKKASVDFTLDDNNDVGSTLWFLTGKTQETVLACKKFAENLNKYDTVIIYDPVDLALIKHQYKEWGIEIKANIVGFNDYLLKLIENKKLIVKNNGKEYSIQDNYAYSRELENSETIRQITEKCGKIKEMLLIKKEANMAGSLIMNEYMSEVQQNVARNRWFNAKNMDCKTLVTENPAEFELLYQTCPDGFRVITVEQMITENL